MKTWIKIKAVSAAFLLALLTSAPYGPEARAASLLPNGEQTFFDGNGKPLSAGCVYFYIPGTGAPKDTYLDPSGTIANTNPVILDAGGRAIIYGTGTYRQVVVKYPCLPSGLQIWDQLTSDPASTIVTYAGASAGTPNAITVNAPTFTGQDGQVVNYVSTNTNTGPATFNPSGFGDVPIVRDNSTGPAALTGGELVATNAVSLMYDATAGVFHIMSPITWPNSAGVPVGTSIDVRGFSAPLNYAFTYGQAVSRSTYAALFSALTLTQSGSITIGSPVITGLADTSQLGLGHPVESAGISTGTILLSCSTGSCTMSTNATTTRTGDITFFAYGNGDGSLTFNLPDDRGRYLVARENMGGTAANTIEVSATLTTTASSTSATVSSTTRITPGMYVLAPGVPPLTIVSAMSGSTLTLNAAATATAAVTARFSQFPDPQALGRPGGSMQALIGVANLPPYTPTGAVTTTLSLVGTVPFEGVLAGSPSGAGGRNTGSTSVNFSGSSASSSFAGVAQGGQTLPLATLPPARVTNRAIRLVP